MPLSRSSVLSRVIRDLAVGSEVQPPVKAFCLGVDILVCKTALRSPNSHISAFFLHHQHSTMAQTSRCGESLPIRVDFDYVQYTTRPDDVPPLPNMSLKEQNQRNIGIENTNNTSIGLTRAYETTAKSGTIPAGLDISSPLQPFFAYSDKNKNLLVFFEQLRNSVSPLPIFLMEYIAEKHMKKAEVLEAEKE